MEQVKNVVHIIRAFQPKKQTSSLISNQTSHPISKYLYRLSEITQDELIEFSIQILQVQKHHRTEFDIDVLEMQTWNIAFFNSLDFIEESERKQLCRDFLAACHYKKCLALETVFEIGSFGKEFYVILKGKVGVVVPIKEKAVSSNQSPRTVMTEVAVLETGKSFGELALIQKGENAGKRSATIVAKEDTHLMVLMKEDYDKLLVNAQGRVITNKLDFFYSIPYFYSWPRSEMKTFIYNFQQKKYNYGQYLYKAGDPSTNIFLLKSGLIKCTKSIKINSLNKDDIVVRDGDISNLYTKRNYKEFELFQFQDNNFIGLIEVFEKSKRKYNMIVNKKDTIVYIISTAEFIKRIENLHHALNNAKKLAKKQKAILKLQIMDIKKTVEKEKNVIIPLNSIILSAQSVEEKTAIFNRLGVKYNGTFESNKKNSSIIVDTKEAAQEEQQIKLKEIFHEKEIIKQKCIKNADQNDDARAKFSEVCSLFMKPSKKTEELLKKIQNRRNQININSNKLPSLANHSFALQSLTSNNTSLIDIVAQSKNVRANNSFITPLSGCTGDSKQTFQDPSNKGSFLHPMPKIPKRKKQSKHERITFSSSPASREFEILGHGQIFINQKRKSNKTSIMKNSSLNHELSQSQIEIKTQQSHKTFELNNIEGFQT